MVSVGTTMRMNNQKELFTHMRKKTPHRYYSEKERYSLCRTSFGWRVYPESYVFGIWVVHPATRKTALFEERYLACLCLDRMIEKSKKERFFDTCVE